MFRNRSLGRFLLFVLIAIVVDIFFLTRMLEVYLFHMLPSLYYKGYVFQNIVIGGAA